MADASHELRTPVSVVRTATQVTLARDGRAERRVPRVADDHRRAGRAACRGWWTTMFLLSRAEAQGVPLRREFLHFDEVARRQCPGGARAGGSARRQRSTIVGAEELGLAGDDALLRQMVGNLLDNAIRHARAERPRRACSSNDPRGHARCCGSRTTARRSRRRTASGSSSGSFASASRTGAGLGLPIARWIAEAHGGTLELEDSRPGCTTFVVTLPHRTGGRNRRLPPPSDRLLTSTSRDVRISGTAPGR